MGCILLPMFLICCVPGVLAWVSFEISALPGHRSWRDRLAFLVGSALVALLGELGILAQAAFRSGTIWAFDPFLSAVLYVAPGLLLASLILRVLGHRRRRPTLLTPANALQLAILLLPLLQLAIEPQLLRVFGLHLSY